MKNNVGCVGTGVEFRFGRNTYVRIPEMILQCGSEGFVVNAMRVQKPTPELPIPPLSSPQIIAEYFHPDTVVDVIDKLDQRPMR